MTPDDSLVSLNNITMTVMQFFSLFIFQFIFALAHQPVYEGKTQQSCCTAAGNSATRLENSIFLQRCSSEHCAPHDEDFPGMPPVRDFHNDSSNMLKFAWSSALAVNITIIPKPWISYDHQNIVILEEDPVVVESASFLFEKHPFRSTLLSYRSGTLHVIRGGGTHLTKNSRVVLVGHGSKGSDRASRLGRYGPVEIATVVGAMKIMGGRIRTLSLLGCYLGSDLHFAKKLLSELRNRNIETKLQLLTSPVSVSPAGEQLTMDGDVWRQRDGSKKVIAWLDIWDTLQTRVENGNRGVIVPNYKGRPLYMQILEWPSHPQMFVPADLRKKYKSIDCLEGLTWSLFFEEREIRRAVDFIPTGDHSPIWLEGHEPEADVMIKHITTILDLVLEIRHHAREDDIFDTYYVLNYFVFKVEKKTLRISLVGKYTDLSNQQEIQMFLDALKDQKDHYTIPELMQNLEASKFNEFCRQTFHTKQCDHNCGRWSYFFMKAVFSASMRNFRTFSLFLMSVIACEVSRSQGKDDSICSAFVSKDYPMMYEDPWPFHERRGFYGCTMDDKEKTKRERLFWLDEVISKENFLYSTSKEMMVGVDHDQETELDVFDKVKVMNQYAFASYLEFFRGTIEGKKLSRGCAAIAVNEPEE